MRHRKVPAALGRSEAIGHPTVSAASATFHSQHFSLFTFIYSIHSFGTVRHAIIYSMYNIYTFSCLIFFPTHDTCRSTSVHIGQVRQGTGHRRKGSWFFSLSSSILCIVFFSSFLLCCQVCPFLIKRV